MGSVVYPAVLISVLTLNLTILLKKYKIWSHYPKAGFSLIYTRIN